MPNNGTNGTAAAEEAGFTNKKAFERLPKTVVPKHYELRIQPYLKDATFDGRAVVHVKVNEAVNRLTVDCAEIKLTEVVFVGEDGKEVHTRDIEYQKEMERVRLDFAANLPVGNGKLIFQYTGLLNDKLRGFYRNAYTVNGEERYGACTQFESCFARQCFPCWDEPAYKATFDITLVVDKHLVALSNMPVKSEEPLATNKAWKVVQYDTTPIMSTYLVALVVGEFDYLEDKTEDGILVRCYTPLGKQDQGRFALDFAVKTLPYYRDFFSVAYPLPKCDLVAVQNFAMGAMENWGCITFRETAVLVDEQNSSAASRQRVALVVGHELAHMWFGNIVTMEWWTELWLNEGFASFVEHISVEKQFPEWKIWNQFVDDFFSSAMRLDALKSSHPIEVPVGHPDEVEEIFDAISYEKGASVIRMLFDFLGEEGFKAGLSKYLKDFEYRNATTLDLWRHFEAATGKPVSSIMSDWTRKKGYPLVDADIEYKDGNAILHLRQKKFSLSNEGETDLWSIPMTMLVLPVKAEPGVKNQTVQHMMNKPADNFTIKNVQPNQPILVNSNLIGFYRVKYSDQLLQLLIPHIATGSLASLDRMGIQGDLMALALSGDGSITTLFELWRSAYKVHEQDPIVWQNILTHVGRLSALFAYTDVFEQYQKFAQDLLLPVLKSIGWSTKEGQGHLEALLRESVLDRLVKSGHLETVAEAQKLLRSITAATRIFLGNSPGYLHCYGCSRRSRDGEAPGYKTLDMALTKDVRSQDVFYVLAGCSHSVEGRERTWEWMKLNWAPLKEHLHPSLLSRGLQSVFGNFVSEEKAAEIEEFLKSHKLEQGERAMEQALETIRIQARWLKRDGAGAQNHRLRPSGNTVCRAPGTAVISVMDDPGAFIKIMARKIGDDAKLLRKNLDKSQKLCNEVEAMTSRGKMEAASAKANSRVFGLPLELLPTSPALIEYKNRLYPVVIPEFIFALGTKLLGCDCTTGLFRIPPNTKRVETAMELINAGQSVNDLSNLHGHDYCGLLKLWARQLPSPILPDIVSGYFLRVFERLSCGKLSKEEACDILMYLGRYVPKRYRETMAFLSYVMSNIARDADKNGMNARNLAICCPNLFIGSYAQRCLDGRQFQSMMYLMEFFIINPHAFLPMDTAATLICEEDVSWVTLRKNSPLPKLDFPSPHTPLPADLASAALPCSFQRGVKKSANFITPLRTQPFRGLGKVAVDLKNKMGRLGLPSCLKPGSSDASGDNCVSSPESLDHSRQSPSNGVFPLPTDFPDDISAMVTPPRDQFRSARRSSTRSGILSHRSYENLDRLGSPLHPGCALPLDFEDVIELLTPSTALCCEPMTPDSAGVSPRNRALMSNAYALGGGCSPRHAPSLDMMHPDVRKELAAVSFGELSPTSGPTR
ncbi:Puromycin-sensitive aminopeptidase [Hypsibius exemplaris]|uniref:Puromycin-sensitive aminopeptidase n=1 Tax=Hypsibius exemplaris TaxID=2072580 RepID=A0A9X6RK19_HYPEX|nr:Puromycin-sensitive aminopeptidase [Hypsibius exemplaris]